MPYFFVFLYVFVLHFMRSIEAYLIARQCCLFLSLVFSTAKYRSCVLMFGCNLRRIGLSQFEVLRQDLINAVKKCTQPKVRTVCLIVVVDPAHFTFALLLACKLHIRNRLL